MSAESLNDVYADELKDLWSANEKMAKVVKVMAEKATDTGLKTTLSKSIDGITHHAEAIKALLLDADEDAEMEHRKGMEGLPKEATKLITKEAPESGQLLDIVIITQYQRMRRRWDSKSTAWRLTKSSATFTREIIYASTLAEHAEEAASSEEKRQ